MEIRPSTGKYENNLRLELSELGVKARHIQLLVQVTQKAPASAAELAEAYHETPGKNKSHIKLYRYVLERLGESAKFREKIQKARQGSAEKEIEIRRAIYWHNLPEEHVLEAARLGLRTVHEFKTFSKIQRITGGAFLVSNRSIGHQRKEHSNYPE